MVPAEITMTDEKQAPETDHRGVDSLTEVLRLQAEALSRISERMSGMKGPASEPSAIPSDVPPRVAPGDGAHLPVLAGDPSLNEESLPVLNSFKKFLDQERRRSRKRILWVLLGFTVAFACVLGVIVWMNLENVQQLNSDINQANDRTERARKTAEAEIRRMEAKAASAAVETAAEMRKDVTRNILWAHTMITSNVTSKIEGRDEELERLKEKISSLEIENTLLTQQINELGRRMKAIEEDYQGFLERPVLEGQMREQDALAAPTNQSASVNRVAPLTINSVRFGRSLQLQVPKE